MFQGSDSPIIGRSHRFGIRRLEAECFRLCAGVAAAAPSPPIFRLLDPESTILKWANAYRKEVDNCVQYDSQRAILMR